MNFWASAPEKTDYIISGIALNFVARLGSHFGPNRSKVVEVKAFGLAFFIVGDHQILTFRRGLGLKLALGFLLGLFGLFFPACPLLLPLAKRCTRSSHECS